MRGGVFVLLCASIMTAQAQFKNIRIVNAETGYTIASSVAVNQKNQENVVAGIGRRVFYSADGGASWNESKLTSSYGVDGNVFVVADSKGHTYLLHAATNTNDASNRARHDRIGIQKSEDGKTWAEHGFIEGDLTKDHLSPRVAIHPRRQTWFATWTQYDQYGLKDAACLTHIQFSKSGGGKKWSTPIQLSRDPGNCLDTKETPSVAMPIVKMDEKLFAAWSNHGTIYFDRSYDGGDTWLGDDVAVTKQVGGWSMPVPGIGEANGMPLLMVDNSTSPYHGSLYIVWSDQTNGEDDTDVWLIRSGNRGDNWTAPKRVNQDEPGKHQFMPWATIDEVTGHIYIVYYDRRAYDDNQTDVYLAYSVDGGSSFKESKISETPFIPEAGKPFSSYNGISAHKGVIVPVWARSDKGEVSVWSATIKEADLQKMK